LQGQIEATTLANKEPSPGIKEGIVEAILAQQQFPLAVSIQQYYEVSRDLTRMSNRLPTICSRDKLSKEDFATYWRRAMAEE
jgi:hypothetical protein